MLPALVMFSLVALGPTGLSSGTCTQNGKIYKIRESVSNDGCNVCLCLGFEMIKCTNHTCLPKTDPDTCQCNGTNYNSSGIFTHYFSVCTCLGENTFLCSAKWLISEGPSTEDLCSPTGMMYQTGYKPVGSCRRCSCGGNVRLDCEQVKCFPSNGTERVRRKDSCYYKDKLYKKDEEFLDDCNKCVCFGTDTVNCTKMSCGQTNPSQVFGTNCSYGNSYYKSGKTFVKDCEQCFCTDYGEVHCLPRSCPPHKKILIIEDSCEYNGFFISKYHEFMDEDCQSCKCVGNDHFLCTKISCNSWRQDYPPLTDYGYDCDYKGKLYKKGEKFTDDGIACFCISRQVKVICTEKPCKLHSVQHLREDSCYYKFRLYKKDEIFLDICKRCVCIGDDNVQCANKTCHLPLLSSKQVRAENCTHKGYTYLPGKAFADGCHDCYCTVFGSVTCLLRWCPSYKWLLRIEDSCEYKGFFFSKDQLFMVENCEFCKCVGNDHLICRKISCNTWADSYHAIRDPLAATCGNYGKVYKIIDDIKNAEGNVTKVQKRRLLIV